MSFQNDIDKKFGPTLYKYYNKEIIKVIGSCINKDLELQNDLDKNEWTIEK